MLRKLIRNPGGLVGLVILAVVALVLLLAPWLAPHDPFEVFPGSSFLPAGSPGHLFGTDDIGRDVLSRILHGTRFTLSIAAVILVIALLLGVPFGLLAGYYPRLDPLLMRVSEVMLTLPAILVALTAALILGTGLAAVIVGVSFYNLAVIARVTRSAVLVERESEYVQAARNLGGSDLRIMFRHILPNLVAPLTVQISFTVATAILVAAALSFLGIGIKPPAPEWGVMLGRGRAYIWTTPHLTIYPGLAIFVTVLGFNLIGDALRDMLDPRHQS
jgi:ABC-type dipeptide/oligopeptide/nickel transport system permease subunit